jgi:hypothetical protein
VLFDRGLAVDQYSNQPEAFAEDDAQAARWRGDAKTIACIAGVSVDLVTPLLLGAKDPEPITEANIRRDFWPLSDLPTLAAISLALGIDFGAEDEEPEQIIRIDAAFRERFPQDEDASWLRP